MEQIVNLVRNIYRNVSDDFDVDLDEDANLATGGARQVGGWSGESSVSENQAKGRAKDEEVRHLKSSSLQSMPIVII